MSEGIDADESARLLRDGALSSSEHLVSGAAGVLLVPLLLKGLGAEAYGLLLAAAAAASLAGLFDCGLEWSVTREIAADRHEARRFAVAAGRVYALLGLAGAAAIAAFGLPLSRGLKLSPESLGAAPWVFVCAGLGFVADRLMVFSKAVLAGLRRFDAAGQLGAGAALLKAGGIAALVWSGRGVRAVAAWQAAAALLTAACALWLIARIEASYAEGWARLDLSPVRPHLPYSLGAAFAAGVSAAYWQLPRLLLGTLGGAAWIAEYHIAQKFPLAVLAVAGRVSGTMFPAASRHERSGDAARLRNVLEAGSRLIVATALPLCLVLWLAAPQLLQAWVGRADSEMILVLRLTAAAVLFEAVAAGPLEVLWSAARLRAASSIYVGCAALNLLLTLALVPRFGMAGAAWGIVLTAACACALILRAASRHCRVRLSELAAGMFRGFFVPGAAAVVLASGGWLLGVKHYHLSLLRHALHFRAARAYLFDPRFRRLADLLENEATSDEKAGLFAAITDTNSGVLLSRKLYREVRMYGSPRIMYKPNLKKLGFYAGAAHVYREFETVDSPALRAAAAALDLRRLVAASYDERGFRRVDPELTRGCDRRVLFLGDSFTDGLWVNDRETFVNRYGHLARERLGAGVCPVNTGVNGYGSLEEAYVLERYYEELGRPGLVFLMYFANDVDEDYGALLDGSLPDVRRKWDESLSYLRRMSRFARARGSTLVIAAIPPAEQFSRPETRRNYQDVLKAFCAREKIRFVDLMDGLGAFDRGSLYWSWDPHLTPRGHEAVAELLLQATKSDLQGRR